MVQAILYGSVLFTLFCPLLAALVLSLLFFFPNDLDRFERITYKFVRMVAIFVLGTSLVALLFFAFHPASYDLINLAKFSLTSDLSVSLVLGFDAHTLIFLDSSALITAIITFYSHRYLHRDPGYRRFFIVISLFSFGINLIVLAQTFDLIFAGWEIVGLSSFLLIGFFWHRPKAVAASCRAFYIYRITDLGLLISLLITHLLWHDFNILSDSLPPISTSWRFLLSLAILLPVLGKSAQFPFSFWLPKAMEGPTHSSAIFYGSLSIHVGVFLLIKTMPIWYFTPLFCYLLASIGILTAITATLCALVQSNIKGQIGYASIAQVGLMLFELSLGFKNLAFFHMIGNAYLRCFQLLVSSSVLTMHLHMQGVIRAFLGLKTFSLPNLFPKKLRPSLFVFALNDGYYEDILKAIVVKPVMAIAYVCNSILSLSVKGLVLRLVSTKNGLKDSTLRSFSPMLIALSLVALFHVFFRAYEIIKVLSLLVAIFLALAALGERKNSLQALGLAIFGNLFAFLSITTNRLGLLYIIGLIVSSLIALEAFRYITMRRTIADLLNYHGLILQFPLAGTVLLIGILGIVSFPISSTFLGEDILLNLSFHSGIHYLIIFQLIFIIIGIALIRLYSLVMLGKRDNAMKDVNLDLSPRQTLVRLLIFALGNLTAFILAFN